MPAMAAAQAGDKTTSPPPVKQALIPEGFFAIKLGDALKLGPPKTEAEAETSLTSLGIVPKNGWIADYPVTPDVIIELQNSVGTAADSGKLAMKKDEATKAVQDVASELGLPVVTAGGQSGQTTSAESYGQYSNPSEINNYYSMKVRQWLPITLRLQIIITCMLGFHLPSGALDSSSPGSSSLTISTLSSIWIITVIITTITIIT